MIDRILLFPYYLTLKIRDARYSRKDAKVSRAAVPTICVGNVTVGGTGKTPHVEMIVRMLMDSDQWGGKNIAVLSLGYKRHRKGFQQVPIGGDAYLFGDEPSQIKSKFPSVTVAVDKNRVEGCDLLCNSEKLLSSKKYRKCLHKDFPKADIIVLDDAFQYRKLKSDKNIVLVNYNNPVSGDMLLPMGTLRDLPSRLFQADILIVTKCPEEMSDAEKTVFAASMGFKEYDPLTCEGVCRKGVRKIFFSRIAYDQAQPVFEESDARYIYSKRLVMFTGIASDYPLLSHLSDNYSIVEKYSFPDHHSFSSSDFRRILSAIRKYPTAAIATTEKDAQRVCAYKKEIPLLLKERMFKIPIHSEFITETEENIFRKEILTR